MVLIAFTYNIVNGGDVELELSSLVSVWNLNGGGPDLDAIVSGLTIAPSATTAMTETVEVDVCVPGEYSNEVTVMN